MNDGMSVKCNLSMGVSASGSMSESVSLSLFVSATGLVKSKWAFGPTTGTGLVVA